MSIDENIVDIAIVGCGPAGLSAALNAKARNKSFRLFGTVVCGQKVIKAPRIDNYLGFPQVTGKELHEHFMQHIQLTGIEVIRSRVDTVIPESDGFTLIARNELYRSRGVVLATGVAVSSTLPGEEELVGKGVSYCATCDAPLYRGKVTIVLAYSREGEEEARHLAQLADRVYFLPQYDYDESSGSLPGNVIVRKVRPFRVLGEERFSALQVRALDTGVKQEESEPVAGPETVEMESQELMGADGLFIIRDETPPARLLPDLKIENNGVVVDRNMQTSIPGVFAAGDCTGRPYQLAKAVGEGQVAALTAARYLDTI